MARKQDYQSAFDVIVNNLFRIDFKVVTCETKKIQSNTFKDSMKNVKLKFEKGQNAKVQLKK